MLAIRNNNAAINNAKAKAFAMFAWNKRVGVPLDEIEKI
jgi:hypothetical protein